MRTGGLGLWDYAWLIKLRQEEEVLKSYHRCMVSKPRLQTACQIHIITHTSCYEQYKYTGSLIVNLIQNDKPQCINIQSPSWECAAGNELKIQMYDLESINTAFLLKIRPFNSSAPFTKWLNIVSNFSAKVVMCICYKWEWNAHADRMLNVDL